MDGGRIVLIHNGDQDDGQVNAMLRGAGLDVTPVRERGGAWLQVQPREVDLFVIVLDLPQFDGMAALRAVRSQGHTPLIVIGPRDRRLLVRYLDHGADDYLSLDHGQEVILAKVRAYLRNRAMWRAPGETSQGYKDDYLHINLNARLVTVDDEDVSLTPKEFDLLRYLVLHEGQAQTHEQILLNVWDKTCLDRPHYVHTYVARLRDKLEKEPQQPVYIQTVYGVGYRFCGV